MPDMGITEILAIASLVAGATETGVSMYQSAQTRDAQLKAQQAAQNQQQQQALLQKKEAVLAANPNVQAQTGGSLTGQAGKSFADILAGYAGSGGSGKSVSSGSSSSTPNIQDVLSQLTQMQQGSGFSGGWSSPNQTQGRKDFSAMQLS